MGYKVPFVDLPKHYQELEKELMPVIKDVLFTRADLIMRGDLKEFEEGIARFVGTRYAVGLNSGTDAIFLSLLAAGIGKGDEVITVAHTFVATVAAIHFSGATPVLVDVGRDHNMNVDLIEKAITKKTKAIIPVHLNGRICHMKKIMELAKKHDLAVIEDACQSLGAKFDGQTAGSIGLTGCFSMYPFKILGGPGDGGILVTNDKAIEEKIRLYRDHSLNRKTMEIVNFGFNSRLDNFHAAILNVKLKYLPNWIIRRREVAKIYQDGLRDVKEITLPLILDENPSFHDVFQNYVITCKERDQLAGFFTENGIETLISWRIPMHFHKGLNLNHFKLPETERISREVVSLPMNTEITNDQVQYVVETIRKFYKK
ncbi:MAG: DegT/DnrJ/EryC1/StrS family aminotransferase [bacterium]|nr:DegT/DnrJ/EryC1/StrS family aminotransferase [bacterium]